MGSSFGKLFNISTFGESHGGGVGVIIDGCPPRLELDINAIQKELNRRRPGQSKITTPRNESDVIAQFIADRITDVGGYDISITAKRLYGEYKRWHEDNADGKPFSIQAFGKRMNQLGHKSEKIGGIKKYLGLEAGL